MLCHLSLWPPSSAGHLTLSGHGVCLSMGLSGTTAGGSLVCAEEATAGAGVATVRLKANASCYDNAVPDVVDDGGFECQDAGEIRTLDARGSQGGENGRASCRETV